MRTNDTNNKRSKLIYPELSYLLTGICFDTHNALGRFARERQYADHLEKKLRELRMPYKRELRWGNTGNILDFLIDSKIVLEIKARKTLVKDDYYQIQRYLQQSGFKLGLLVNFNNRYLKPLRIVRIETDARQKFV